MADSLRDQLLKSGLVQKLKAEAKPARPEPRRGDGQRADKPRHDGARGEKPHGGKPHGGKPHASAPKPAHKPSAPREPDLAQAYAQRARLEREERERAQREAEQAAREKRERKQKLAALLDGKALNAADADLPRHFPHGNKIRRIYCTAAQLAQLNRGDLAVVQLAGRYLLVAREVALAAQAIQPDALVLLCDPNAPSDDDVPPDLVW